MTEATEVQVSGATYTALDLSEMTYGSVPAADDSPGARWLRSVAEAYDPDELRDGDWNDAIFEQAARLSTGLGSQELWLVVADLKLFADAQDGSLDYGLWSEEFTYENPRTFKNEDVRGVRWDKLAEALQWWLHETAALLLNKLRQRDPENNPDTEDEDD